MKYIKLEAAHALSVIPHFSRNYLLAHLMAAFAVLSIVVCNDIV